MYLPDGSLLTYCSNIHPGDSWPEVFNNLKRYVCAVKSAMQVSPFGIGLRLSDQASKTLIQKDELSRFISWLQKEDLFVCTINGFPFGGFHQQVVKDQVHHPDWTTKDRLDYTLRLFDILAELLPEGLDGGVSTSPISYKHWHEDDLAKEKVKSTAVSNLVEVVIHLDSIKNDTGKILHLDIEPEPDGLVETGQEFIDFYCDYLLRDGAAQIEERLHCTKSQAEVMIRTHIQLCYDVCHFAVGFEEAKSSIHDFDREGIQIGRIQISAALSSGMVSSSAELSARRNALAQFDEPVYLHQAVLRKADQALVRYPDLKPALDQWREVPSEIRTHFHVPVFLQEYGGLYSTQQDIKEVLRIWQHQKFTRHLEVETYTWDVLPEDMRMSIVQSVTRELNWVKSQLIR